ncbi:MAG TPA: ankyrin repeat domain-containing protein [Bryobacteraceae bacterium]|nr:ankyrin repeat domain-containing protein [Bryobacteraceae bacterium]
MKQRIVKFLIVGAAALVAQTPDKIDFGREVQPIFQTNCYGCHGPSQQMGGLRLDRRRDAMRGGTIPVIAPGTSAGSRLYLRLMGNEYGPQMPLAGSLAPAQIGIIKAWIDQGAAWPDKYSGATPAPPPNPIAERIMEAIRAGDQALFRSLLAANPKIGNLKGAGGSTPLMYAVLYGDAESVRRLLADGADPHMANDEGATALMWAAHDVEKARLLIDHGANVNAQSRGMRTALMIAAGKRGNSGVVELLLEHGANPSAHSPGLGADVTPLAEAAYVADASIVKLLLKHGADVKAAVPMALYNAVLAGCSECLELLMNSCSKEDLSLAAVVVSPPRGDARAVGRLVEHGAGPNAKDHDGHSLLMLAAASDNVSVPLIQDLLRHGAEVNARDPQGHTALDFAESRGMNPVAETLIQAGARPGNPFSAASVTPAPAHTVRAAVERSLALLQSTDAAFLRKSGCVSCHNNAFAAMTLAAARQSGFAVNDETARLCVKTIANYIDGWRDRALLGTGIPGDADTMSYVLLDLAAANFQPNPSTEAIAGFMVDHQQADGHWFIFAHRPPIESSDFEVTATSMHAIQIYGRKTESTEASVRRAAAWLEGAQPSTVDDRAFQLLGISWAHAGKESIHRAADGLLAMQRADGGWAQLPSLESDAYATGEALVALRESGSLTSRDPAFQRGVRFLLNTQLGDGSWYVHSHALRIQPYFDSGFPHGRDQFVSAAATNWATQALALAAR